MPLRAPHHRLCFALAGLAALALAGPTAAGQPLPSASDRARDEFQQGYHALVADQYGQALAHFEASYRLQPNPEMLFNIGMACRSLGRYLDALDAWGRYLSTASSTADPTRLALVRANSAEAERQVAHVTVTASQPGASILIDGRTQTGLEVRVDPGAHVVQCELAGQSPQRREIRATPGEHIELAFAFDGPTPSLRPLLPPLQAPLPPVTPARASLAAPLFWGGLGVAVPAAATALALGLTGNSLRDDYVSQCVGVAQRPDCADFQRATQSSLDARSLAANVLSIAAGAGLAVALVGVVLGLTHRESRPQAAPRITLAPQGLGVGVVW